MSAVPNVDMHATGIRWVGEFGVVDPNLAEHALERVNVPADKRHLRDVALGFVTRQARLVRPKRSVNTRARGDGDLTPPAAELDDDRYVVSDRYVGEFEFAIRPCEDANERLPADVCTASVTRHARCERLYGRVRDVNKSIVKWIRDAKPRWGRRVYDATHAGRSVTGAGRLLETKVRAWSSIATHVSQHLSASLAVRTVRVAVERSSAAVANCSAILNAVRCRAGVWEAVRVAAQIWNAPPPASLRSGTPWATEGATTTVANGAAIVTTGEVARGGRQGGACPAAAAIWDIGAAASLTRRTSRRAGEGSAAAVTDNSAVLAAGGRTGGGDAACGAADIRDARAPAGLTRRTRQAAVECASASVTDDPAVGCPRHRATRLGYTTDSDADVLGGIARSARRAR